MVMVLTPRAGGAVLQIVHPLSGGEHVFAIGATSSAATTGFSSNILRVVATANVNVTWVGASSQATASVGQGMYYAAGVPEYLEMATSRFPAYISATGALGNLYITECA